MQVNQLLSKWLSLSILLLLTASLSAQMRTISGTITSTDGESLIGATVLVENSVARGTSTDFDGKFSIEVKTGETLSISYTGYETKTVPVTAESVYTIVMEMNSEVLDVVVVVGYGTQKKRDLTGAVSSISSDDIQNSVVTNVDQALQGRVAGVQVTQNSGQPGGGALSESGDPILLQDPVSPFM